MLMINNPMVIAISTVSEASENSVNSGHIVFTHKHHNATIRGAKHKRRRSFNAKLETFCSFLRCQLSLSSCPNSMSYIGRTGWLTEQEASNAAKYGFLEKKSIIDYTMAMPLVTLAFGLLWILTVSPKSVLQPRNIRSQMISLIWRLILRKVIQVHTK